MTEKDELPLLQRIERQALEEGREFVRKRMEDLIAEEKKKSRRKAEKKKGSRRKKKNTD